MPTCVRGQGIALVNVMSMISQMASPYIVYSVSTSHCLPYLYSPLLQSVWSEKAPFLITGLLSLLGAVPGLFLPETADLKMPDTLEVSLRIAHCYPHAVLLTVGVAQDIAEFGRHDRLLWMPLCRRRRRFRRGVMGLVQPGLSKEEIILTPSAVKENKGFDL